MFILVEKVNAAPMAATPIPVATCVAVSSTPDAAPARCGGTLESATRSRG
jgi:GTP cyclohydrolase III